MYKVSSIISEIYNKYLPLAEQKHIQLNVDLGNNSESTDKPNKVRRSIEEYLDLAMRNSCQNAITIRIKNNHVVIADDKILPRSAFAKLDKEQIQVKTRIGFGTTVVINY